MDEASGQTNFCGPITASIQANQTTSGFLTEDFDSATNTLEVTVETNDEAHVAYYLLQLKVVLDDYDFEEVLDDEAVLNIYYVSPCHYSELNALTFTESYEYYVWQEALTGSVTVTDDCTDCNCEWTLTYSQVPKDAAHDYLTIDASTGDFEIYSESLASVNDEGAFWETEITVSYEGYDTSGTVTGTLAYTMLHPCLKNEAEITFTSASQDIEYDVCQSEDETGAEFSWTDSLSELTGTPNYCGVPDFEAEYEGEYSDTFKGSLSLEKDAATNTGYVKYAKAMCNRNDVDMETPYQFKIKLSYADDWTSKTTDDLVSVKLNDPCVDAVWPAQTFFGEFEGDDDCHEHHDDADFFRIRVNGLTTLTFDISAGYQPDDVTVAKNIPYFCGEPSYKVIVMIKTTEEEIYNSDEDATGSFATVNYPDPAATPPTTATTLVLRSTSWADAGVYTVKAIATVEDQELDQSITLTIMNRCSNTKLIDNISSLRQMNYTIGKEELKVPFTLPDTWATSIGTPDRCGERVVACQLKSEDPTLDFFSFETDVEGWEYHFALHTDNTAFVGRWNGFC